MAKNDSIPPYALHSKQGAPVQQLKGYRPMKFYSLCDSDLRDISRSGYLSTFCFSVSAALFAFLGGVRWDLSMIETPTESQKNTAEAYTLFCLVLGGILLVAAIGIVFVNYLSMRRIKKEHNFMMEVE